MNFPLDGFVKLGQVDTDSYFAIWFEARDNSCTPFSRSCYRRDDLVQALSLSDFSPWVTGDEGVSVDCIGKRA